MLKIGRLLSATAGVILASTGVFAAPLPSSSAPDISFSVFFNPGAASLTKEGREIVAIAARQFVAFREDHPAAQLFVTGETDGQDSASLSKARIGAVRNQLVRDGVQRKFVSAGEQPSVHAAPVRLLESLDRRVSISIQENLIVGRLKAAPGDRP